MEYVRRYRDSGLDRLAYTVRLDDRDIAVLVQSLGHLRAVKADYFDRVYRGWVGVDQEVLEALSVRIHALAGSQQAEVTFTKSDMIVLLRCTCELADGLAPPDWEFGTIFGFRRSDARAVLHYLHDILVSGSRKPVDLG